PLLSSCPMPDVFNPATGFCERYETVENCTEFYSGAQEIVNMKMESEFEDI
ncbi:Cuticular protein -like protein to peritrophins 3A2, partial [Caligus rogercresseyi]